MPYFYRSPGAALIYMTSLLRLVVVGCLCWTFFIFLLSGDVVRKKKSTAGGLDGWGWKELKTLPPPWFDGLARILRLVEETGVWPDGLLDAYVAMILKSGGDATPLGPRPLRVLPVVERIWASARMMQLEPWFKSWVPSLL